MKPPKQNRFGWLWFSITVFWVLFWVFYSFPASALTIPAVLPSDVVGQFSPYDNAAVRAAYDKVGISYTYPPNVTTPANPEGYTGKVSGSSIILESSPTVSVRPPAGSPVSPYEFTSALAAVGGAGAAAATGVAVKSAPVAAAAVSAMTKAALGVGSGAMAVLLAPEVAAALTAVSIGMVGFNLVQALKNDGITVDPSGAVLAVPSPSSVSARGSYSIPPAASCAARGFISLYGVTATCVVPLYPSPCHVAIDYGDVMFVDSVCYAALPVNSPSPSPATQDQLAASIDRLAASNTALAADMASYALQHGASPPAGFAPSSPPLSLASDFAKVKQSIDSLGNTVQTLERTLVKVSPSVAGSPPKLDVLSESVNLVNAAPASVTQTSLAPAISVGLASATAVADKTKLADLCVDHPDILACANIAAVSDVPAAPLTNKDIQLGALSPVSVGSPVAFCPAPLVIPSMFGGVPMVLNFWQPACNFADSIKAINIAAAGLFSMFILIGGFKNG